MQFDKKTLKRLIRDNQDTFNLLQEQRGAYEDQDNRRVETDTYDNCQI